MLIDLGFASSECFADEGVETPEGWRSLDLIGIPLLKVDGEPVYNRIPFSTRHAEAAHRLALELGIRGEIGPFLTVSTCSGTLARGEELLRRFPGICENMEGAAVAQAALLHGTDFLEVRGVSNLVEERDLSRWDIPRAVEQAQRFLLCYLERTPS